MRVANFLGWLVMLFIMIGIGSLYFLKFPKFETRISVEELRYLKYSPHSNGSKFTKGFVSVMVHTKYEDGYFGRTDEGNYVLISKFFGSDEYRCLGSCYCEAENEEGRRLSNTLSNGLVYLVVSITSIIAYQKAKEYFQSECESRFSGICDDSFVISEVDDCQSVEKIGASMVDENYIPDTRRYFCKGNCVTRQLYFRMNGAAESPKCKTLEIEGLVEFDALYKKGKIFADTYARAEFEKEILIPFCRKSSKVKHWYSLEDGKISWLDLWLCDGNRDVLNKSVQCIKLKP